MRKLNMSIDEDAPTDIFVREREGRAGRISGPAQETLWDANDVARYLRVSRSWVYHRAEAGQLPLRRIGGLLRFDPAAIRAFAVGEHTNAQGTQRRGGGRLAARAAGATLKDR
jgi:excisionase family DNA binding protein